ncbi:MAG: hypothetical protein A2381_07520 [Bdellovibrionales bacterium RIFOXYB1_FULL_37_110]|nr:MAG: hypothetical protein A2181_04285 [Bdellovibrionales bacterium RIFOXYA1_FULL_38_20]OFZ52456.1 MAG: hypothetical protein A2417_00240 [Bdellovibrionales bacterium RIFOXYC1_FULL_37_79]OFZ59658.1 MAG: hypothetical protein A2381_07520 [Bdellovibrionales bacterium RIFOXYB1_FULL_37_110]OFZ61090.1 MAG: hypothetical protein A2328_07535 [Bdellovibrionales bacterium RIFOXYB2_FULL_36_6]OFZ62585.1 MAG: hypothetical protein A2577_11840 [Bdellovibrionales bacterium RIFOXYD1_FULL_36_51]
MFKHLKSFLSGFDISCSDRSQRKTGTTNQQALFFDLIKLWPQIVGNHLAQHSTPLKNTHKTLTILTDHPQWAQELSFLEKKIKHQIFKTIPKLSYEIKKIKFQADNTFFKNQNLRILDTPPPCPCQTETELKKQALQSPNLHPFSPEYLKYQQEAVNLFGNIEDEETKNLLTSIFITHKHQNNRSV